MRDLYHLLGDTVGPNTPDTELRAAIARLALDDEVRRSAEAILLNPDRKQIYDQTLDVFRTVARLRRRFGVERTDLWNREALASLHPWHKPWRRSQVRPWALILAFFVVVVPPTIGIVALLQRSMPSSVQSPTPTVRESEAPRTPPTRPTSQVSPPASATKESTGSTPNTGTPVVVADLPREERRPLPLPEVWEPLEAIAEYRQRRLRPIGSIAIPNWYEPAPVPEVSTITSTLGALIPGGQCGLRVIAPPDRHAYLKIIDVTNRVLCTPVFVPKGRSVILKISPGIYDLLFAFGDRWYGWKFDFGPSAIYLSAAGGLKIAAGSDVITFDFQEGMPEGMKDLSRAMFD